MSLSLVTWTVTVVIHGMIAWLYIDRYFTFHLLLWKAAPKVSKKVDLNRFLHSIYVRNQSSRWLILVMFYLQVYLNGTLCFANTLENLW